MLRSNGVYIVFGSDIICSKLDVENQFLFLLFLCFFLLFLISFLGSIIIIALPVSVILLFRIVFHRIALYLYLHAAVEQGCPLIKICLLGFFLVFFSFLLLRLLLLFFCFVLISFSCSVTFYVYLFYLCIVNFPVQYFLAYYSLSFTLF